MNTPSLGYYGQHAMQGMGRLGSLGDAVTDWFASNPDAAGGSSGSGTTSTPKKSASDWVSDILGWGKTASEAYHNTQTGGSGGGGVVVNVPAPASTGMSTTTKLAIGAGVVVLGGGLIYALTKKKK